MATIFRELQLAARPQDVWSAVRDAGAVHERLAPGFVTDCRMDGDARVVTFANGMVVREPIVAIDEARRRLAYSAAGGRATFYAAAMQVFDAPGGGTRLEWTIDLLPDAVAAPVAAMVEQGLAAMKRQLERPA